MTEQIEDDFWAAERAHAAAERGRQADPSACGTCRDRVAAGGQVEHDECARRATLLPAPDAPGYELITGMTEQEVRALPPRFHTPVFMDTCTPTMWVCAVCWGDGWSAQWPCPTAYEHGTKVFTPEHQADAVAKKQAAELAEHRAEATTPLVVARFDTAMEHALEEPPGLTVGAIAEDGRPVALVFDEEARAKVAGWLAPVDEGLVERETYPPALPWAQLMDDDDLADFLDDLANAAAEPGTDALHAVEDTCARHRAIAEAQHAHNTANGPNTAAGESR